MKVLALATVKYVYKSERPKVFFQLEIITNLLISSFGAFKQLCFGYGSMTIIFFYSFIAGTDLRSQKLTSKIDLCKV